MAECLKVTEMTKDDGNDGFTRVYEYLKLD